MKQCFICKKVQKSGFCVSHSHKKNKRSFIPNLHSRTLKVKDEKIKVKICTSCLKNIGK